MPRTGQRRRHRAPRWCQAPKASGVDAAALDESSLEGYKADGVGAAGQRCGSVGKPSRLVRAQRFIVVHSGGCSSFGQGGGKQASPACRHGFRLGLGKSGKSSARPAQVRLKQIPAAQGDWARQGLGKSLLVTRCRLALGKSVCPPPFWRAQSRVYRPVPVLGVGTGPVCTHKCKFPCFDALPARAVVLHGGGRSQPSRSPLYQAQRERAAMPRAAVLVLLPCAAHALCGSCVMRDAAGWGSSRRRSGMFAGTTVPVKKRIRRVSRSRLEDLQQPGPAFGVGGMSGSLSPEGRYGRGATGHSRSPLLAKNAFHIESCPSGGRSGLSQLSPSCAALPKLLLLLGRVEQHLRSVGGSVGAPLAFPWRNGMSSGTFRQCRSNGAGGSLWARGSCRLIPKPMIRDVPSIQSWGGNHSTGFCPGLLCSALPRPLGVPQLTPGGVCCGVKTTEYRPLARRAPRAGVRPASVTPHTHTHAGALCATDTARGPIPICRGLRHDMSILPLSTLRRVELSTPCRHVEIPASHTAGEGAQAQVPGRVLTQTTTFWDSGHLCLAPGPGPDGGVVWSCGTHGMVLWYVTVVWLRGTVGWSAQPRPRCRAGCSLRLLLLGPCIRGAESDYYFLEAVWHLGLPLPPVKPVCVLPWAP
eukprot:gene6195-biopygen22324